MNPYRLVRSWLVLLLVNLVCWSSVVRADRPGWQRRQVNWRMTGGARIEAVNYPREKQPQMLVKQDGRRPRAPRKKTLPAKAALRLVPLTEESAQPIIASVIDSPPIDGFVPLVAVSITDKRYPEIDTRFDANAPNFTIEGSHPTPVDPQADYAIGIFDTGASAHVMSNMAAIQAGLFYGGSLNDLLTSNTVEIAGVTGSVLAWVSQPLGLYVDGLGAIEPNGLLIDDSGMVGEWNVSIAVGRYDSPNLPTAIGSPLAVYYATAFRNEQLITVNYNGEDFNSPDLRFYDLDDPCIPNYSNVIPLELRPLGGVNVQYIPTLDLFNFEPASPSTIVGFLAQSIFFVHSVDLYEGQEMAYDQDRFMFDTGAQVTVVGSRVASRLRLDPNDPEFEVEIQGVTGDSIMAPGFYIDSLEIPALGEWLSFTNIPVILLDISSPEGGTVDGIIGMNLFVEYNFVLRGGGLFLQDDPAIEFGPIPHHIVADIAPRGGDGVVDFLDLAVFVQAWLATSSSPDWNAKCDMAPPSNPDGKVDFLDLAVLGELWLGSATP